MLGAQGGWPPGKCGDGCGSIEVQGLFCDWFERILGAGCKRLWHLICGRVPRVVRCVVATGGVVWMTSGWESVDGV